jgi:hypothetical protein
MKKQAITVAALAAALAAGCSSSGSSVSATSSPESACATPSNYPGLCGTGSPSPAASTGPGDVPVMLTVRQGQPFTLSYTENNVPVSWQVALDSITCGGGGIFSRKVLAASDASTGEPLVIPKPDQGQKFCLVKFSVTNDGHSDQPWSANDATVNIGMNAYSDNAAQGGTGPGTAWDAEQAYMQSAQPHGETADFGINPGVHAVSWAVFEIPAQDQPTSVGVPDGTAMDEIGGVEQVLVNVS